jgi:nucleotide-binding universal stress UspA family protein
MTLKAPLMSSKILVATSFDERLEAQVSAAETLSLRTGAPVKFLHVCEPPVIALGGVTARDESHDLMRAIQEERRQVATRRLQTLVSTLRRGLTLEFESVIGEVIPTLVKACEDEEVGLVIVGAARKDPAGFSTAVNLLTETSCPVLVMNEAARLSGHEHGLRVLLADDLSDASMSAVDFALGLALYLPGCQLMHLHVQSATEVEMLKKTHPSVGSLLTVDQWTASRRDAESMLIKRAGEAAHRLETSGGRYQAEVTAGHVFEEIQRSALAMRADLVICGEHHVFHWPTMQAGQVPYRQMLAGPRPVIVVPQAG